MTTLARSLSAALAVAALSFLSPATQAAPGSAGGHGGGFAGGHGGGYGGHHGGGYHRGGGYGGGYRGGYWRGGYWGPRGYWGPGPFWGGLGIGLGVGAVVYSSGYYGGHYGGYRGPYYDGVVYDSDAGSPEVVVLPVPEGRVYRSGQSVPPAGRAVEPIFYPKNGQSAAALENDRRDCNRWATTQANAMADASIFQRATHACMEGRGYTVK